MIRFLSKAAASFVMTDVVAEQVFKAVRQEFHSPGVWTVERLPTLQIALEAALQASKESDARAERAIEQARNQAIAEGQLDILAAQELPVGLSRRLVPVLQMVRVALAEGEPIVWERA
ncbi:MAG: hypothetical protein RLZZ344_1459 [Pseudomonadota bacterium]|jgi:hypothetical protein